LQNPYKLVDSENGYTFETEYGQIYSLSFLFYLPININPNYKIYTFNLEPLNTVRSISDIRIELTIRFALKKFFENKLNALVVVFDSFDGRHHARARLFDRWYKNSNAGNIDKIDATGKIDDIEIISSLFLETTNPFYEEIKSSFTELANLNFYF
jgi:hypothetical protein